MSSSTYRYFVKPLSDNANEMIADYLTASAPSTIDTQKRKIETDKGIVMGVYQVPHSFLTELKRSIHYKQVRVYVQENEGKIRPYALFSKGKTPIASSKAFKEVQAALARKKSVNKPL